MPGIILARTYAKRTLKTGEVRLELLNELRSQGRSIRRKYEATVVDWEGEKPVFEIGGPSLRGGVASISIGLKAGGGDGNGKYIWLDHGTAIRWAVMGRNFIRKTHPNSMSTNPGVDDVAIKGMQAMMKRGIPPRPGIAARNYTKTILKNNKKPFNDAIIAAVKRGISKAMKP